MDMTTNTLDTVSLKDFVIPASGIVSTNITFNPSEFAETTTDITITTKDFDFPSWLTELTTTEPLILTGNLITSGVFFNKPMIKNVKVISQEGNPIGVLVFFEDGTKQKAICQKGDTFNLETGIAMCLLKWFYADKPDGSDGTKNANNAIKNAIKVRDKNLALIAEEKKKKAELKEANRKFEEKRHKKSLKRREARIREMVEAIERASVDNQ